MKKFKVITIILLMLILSLQVGCNDKVEMDQRWFISTIGIDAGDDIDNLDKLKSIKGDEPFQEREVKKFKVTFSYPDMGQLGPGKSAVVDSKTIKTDAYSLEDAVNKAKGKSSRNVYLGHSKLVLLSSSIMSNEEVLKEIVDYLQRSTEINGTMNVVVCEGSAESFIEFKSDMENNIEFYIDGLMRNAEENSSIFRTDLNDILARLNENGTALFPRLTLDPVKEELVLDGVFIVKDFKLVGKLNSIETGDLNILRGTVSGLNKVIYMDGHPVDFIIRGVDKKIKVEKISDEKLDITIDVKVKGDIKGFYFEEDGTLIDKINIIEENISKSLSEECTIIANNIKEDYQVDPINIRDYITKFKPFLWNEIKEEWDDVYMNSELTVNLEANIRRMGTSD